MPIAPVPISPIRKLINHLLTSNDEFSVSLITEFLRRSYSEIFADDTSRIDHAFPYYITIDDASTVNLSYLLAFYNQSVDSLDYQTRYTYSLSDNSSLLYGYLSTRGNIDDTNLILRYLATFANQDDSSIIHELGYVYNPFQVYSLDDNSNIRYVLNYTHSVLNDIELSVAYALTISNQDSSNVQFASQYNIANISSDTITVTERLKTGVDERNDWLFSSTTREGWILTDG